MVIALTLELICLVRTNQVSGAIIGSLSDKAEAAENKAEEAKAKSQEAVTNAATALGKSKEAGDEAGKANALANGAKAQSTEAQNTAKQALADAGTAKQGAQQVLEQAKELSDNVDEEEKAALPRKLNQKPFADNLKQVKGFPVLIETIADFEAERTAARQ